MRCLRIMRPRWTPKASDAWIYSNSRSFKVSPRRMRHKPVQLPIPMMRQRLNNPCPKEEHESNDQQDRRNGIKRGIDVLNGIVYPTPKITSNNTEKYGEWHSNQGGKSTDNESSPDAFQGTIEDITAHFVSAKQMTPRILKWGIVTNRASIRCLEGAFCIQMCCQRSRIGFLGPFSKWCAKPIKEAQASRSIDDSTLFISSQCLIGLSYQWIAPTDTIQHTDEKVPQENKKANNSEAVSANLPCRVPPILLLRGVSEEPSRTDKAYEDNETVIGIGTPNPTQPIRNPDVWCICPNEKNRHIILVVSYQFSVVG